MSNNSVKIPALPCKLLGQCHYIVWRNFACRMLKVQGLWNLVNSTSKHPVFTRSTTTVTISSEEVEEETSGNAEEISKWDKKDDLAVIFLQCNIEFEVILMLTLADTVHHLWTQLEDKFDQETASSLHSLLANISSLFTGTSNSPDKTKDPIGYHLHQLASVSEVKPNLTFNDINEKLMDLESWRNNDGQATVQAYHIRGGNPGHGRNNKNGEYSKGQIHKDCWKLKAFRVKEKSAASGNLNIVSGTAFHTKLDFSWIPDFSGLSELEVADAFTMRVSFNFITFSGTSDVIVEEYFGFLAGPSRSDNKACIFEPGATNYMTETQVTNASSYSGTVTFGGWRKLQITGIGNITINRLYSPITLQNVFLIPELDNTNLMSWSYIAKKRFTTIGTENGFTIYKLNNMYIIAVANANSTGLYIFETKELCVHISIATRFYHWH
ncbi:uncharacterized protein H6S33_006988 [Morchella sextelata]|uniref:uncharacterized protein n=1 Tax=Morchella sextelata TaxID=1174677 RepID=UPI001D04C81C|nr:uncharacterized protein H6S33_006988 [Morchella sextelata]KAH0603957.1 hypothetical protein H6S33_006988 [Morchella sextelata]